MTTLKTLKIPQHIPCFEVEFQENGRLRVLYFKDSRTRMVHDIVEYSKTESINFILEFSAIEGRKISLRKDMELFTWKGKASLRKLIEEITN